MRRSKSEKSIEKECKRLVEAKEGEFIKLLPFTISGLPDRLVILPNRPIFFVELKKAGEEPSPLQRVVHRFLLKLGQAVYVCDNVDGFKVILLKHLKLPTYDFGVTD